MSGKSRLEGQAPLVLWLLLLSPGILRADDDPCLSFRAGDGTKRDACADATIASLTEEDYSAAVGRLDGMGEGIAPKLIKALSSSQWLTRAAAADALGRMGKRASAPEVMVNALAAHAKDKEAKVRQQVFGAIGRIGRKTPAAEEAVRQGLLDSDLLARHLAGYASAELK